jgi:hypothetical protein
MESYFDENGIDTHKNWVFSTENSAVIGAIIDVITEKLEICDEIPKPKMIEYFMAWTVV